MNYVLTWHGKSWLDASKWSSTTVSHGRDLDDVVLENPRNFRHGQHYIMRAYHKLQNGVRKILEVCKTPSGRFEPCITYEHSLCYCNILALTLVLGSIGEPRVHVTLAIVLDWTHIENAHNA